MSTDALYHSPVPALFSKAQCALLSLFFTHPEQSFYVREVVRRAGIGQGAIQRELRRWTEAGLLLRTRRGNQVYYQANDQSPVFPELKSLAVKTTGVVDVLRDALVKLAESIHLAFVHGSIAEGTEKPDSDVDLIVIGGVGFGNVTSALSEAQDVLGREINPTVYTELEFRQKLRAGHHFLTSVSSKPKLFIIGDEHEFERLGS